MREGGYFQTTLSDHVLHKTQQKGSSAGEEIATACLRTTMSPAKGGIAATASSWQTSFC